MNTNDRFLGDVDVITPGWCEDQACHTCGAIVNDKELHNEWHNTLKKELLNESKDS